MRTAIEVSKDGTRTVFHRRGNMVWTHPVGEQYRYQSQARGARRGTWITVPCGCFPEAVLTPVSTLRSVQKSSGVSQEGRLQTSEATGT